MCVWGERLQYVCLGEGVTVHVRVLGGGEGVTVGLSIYR